MIKEGDKEITSEEREINRRKKNKEKRTEKRKHDD